MARIYGYEYNFFGTRMQEINAYRFRLSARKIKHRYQQIILVSCLRGSNLT